MSLAKSKGKPWTKNGKTQSWPESMYLEGNVQDDPSSYHRYSENWEHPDSVEGYDIRHNANHFGTPPRHRHISTSPQFLNIATPPPSFVHRSPRKAPYDRGRQIYDYRERLSTIPERGAKGIAGAGRAPGTLTASEIAEVSSNLGNNNIIIDPSASNGTRKDRRPRAEVLQMEEIHGNPERNVVPPNQKLAEGDKKEDTAVKLSEIKHLRLIVASVVVLILLIVIASVVAIYISLQSNDDQDQIRLYNFTMRLTTATYKRELGNTESTAFKNLERELCDVMYVIHSDLKVCEVERFRNGSVIVDFRLGTPQNSLDSYKMENPNEMYMVHLIRVTRKAFSSKTPNQIKSFVERFNPVDMMTDFWKPEDPKPSTTARSTTSQSPITESNSSTTLAIASTIATTVADVTTSETVTSVQMTLATSATPSSTTTTENVTSHTSAISSTAATTRMEPAETTTSTNATTQTSATMSSTTSSVTFNTEAENSTEALVTAPNTVEVTEEVSTNSSSLVTTDDLSTNGTLS